MTDISPTGSHDLIARLRAANPAELNPYRAHAPAARAALDRILADSSQDDASPPLARLRGRLQARSARSLAAVGAALLVGAGGALAATDPMGWWSITPDQASYASDQSVRVATPTAGTIRCQTNAASDTACTPTSALRRGQTYTRIGSIPRPQSTSVFTRRSFLAHIRSARAQGRISATSAARLRADIAAAPDSFFTTMALASRYGTFAIVSRTAPGKTLAPPAGTPAFLVCQDAPGGRLSCRNLNGDNNAPVGAGVYAAHPTRSWRAIAATRPASENRLLDDMLRFGTVLRGSSHGRSIRTS